MRSFSATLFRPSRRKGRPPDRIIPNGIASSSKVLVTDQSDRIRIPTSRRALLHHDSIGQPPNAQSQRNRSASSSNKGLIRYLHATQQTLKPPPSFSVNDKVYLMEAAIPTSDHAQPYLPDPSSILTEWRLLERRLREADGKEKAKSIDQEEKGLDQHSLPVSQLFDPEFFSAYSRPSNLSESEAQEVSTTHTKTINTTQNIAVEQLWTTNLDKKIVDRMIETIKSEIRSGSRDVQTLALNLLSIADESNSAEKKAPEISQQLRLEELRMFILSFWITVTSQKIFSVRHDKIPSYISVTKALYDSSLDVALLAKGEFHSPNIIAIQRSTLYRIFGNLFNLTNLRLDLKPFDRAKIYDFCAKLACDSRLRPSQQRYMVRKILGRLIFSIEERDEVSKEGLVWEKVNDMLYNLMNQGIIQPPKRSEIDEKNGSFKESYNPISRFMLSCTMAIQSRLAPFGLSQHTLLAMAKNISIMKTNNANETFTFSKTSQQLEKMINSLLKGKQIRTAYQLYLRSPIELRTFDIVSSLIRYYGDSPLSLSSQYEYHSNRSKGSSASRSLMAKALEEIGKSEENERDEKVKKLAYARFAFCGNNGMASRVMEELRDFIKVFGNGDQIKQSQFLVQLGEPVYCQFVRALAKGGRWKTSKDIALRIVQYEKRINSAAKQQSAIILNVLLRGYLWPSPQGFQRYHFSKYSQRYNLVHSRTKQPSFHSLLSTSPERNQISRWKRTKNALKFLKHFCQKTDIKPDETTIVILLDSLRQCKLQNISKEKYFELKKEIKHNNNDVKSIIKTLEDVMNEQ